MPLSQLTLQGVQTDFGTPIDIAYAVGSYVVNRRYVETSDGFSTGTIIRTGKAVATNLIEWDVRQYQITLLAQAILDVQEHCCTNTTTPTPTQADKFYQHLQTTAATEWIITHNLLKYPSIVVQDSAGSTIVGAVHYLDNNTVIITFSTPFMGVAYCN